MSNAKGEKFFVQEVPVNQNRFSQEEAKKYMTVEQFESCKVPSSYIKLECNRISGEKPKFVMPTLSNYTKEALADAIGEVREQMKSLEKLEGVYKQALTGRWKQEELERIEEEQKAKEAKTKATTSTTTSAKKQPKK